MLTLSKTEIDFIAKAIQGNVRMDMREKNCKREQKIIENGKFASALVDRSILIERGYSKVNLSIIFRSSANTLKTLNLCFNSDFENDFKTLQCPFLDKMNPSLKKIENFLDACNIGCFIEIYVIKNDGNIFDMIMDGLRHIFTSINVPNIHALSESVLKSVDLPLCNSYAVYGSDVISDPTSLEEAASDGIVRIFEGEETCIISEGSIDFDNFNVNMFV